MLLPPTARALWKMLHTFPERLPPGPLDASTCAAVHAFMQAFEEALVTGSLGSACACSTHWMHHLAHRPPSLTTRQAFLQWTYDIHDDVNASLGKPRLDLHAPPDIIAPTTH